MSKIVIDWTQNYDECPYFTLEGQIIECKVVKVYDGDSIHVVFPYFNKMYKWSCRLSGIDTPEIRTSSDIEKKYGYMVRDKLYDKIYNKVIIIKCGEYDKYGRLLCKIFDSNDSLEKITSNNSFQLSINNWLICNKYAFPYNGGTKQSWEDYLLKHPELLE